MRATMEEEIWRNDDETKKFLNLSRLSEEIFLILYYALQRNRFCDKSIIYRWYIIDPISQTTSEIIPLSPRSINIVFVYTCPGNYRMENMV